MPAFFNISVFIKNLIFFVVYKFYKVLSLFQKKLNGFGFRAFYIYYLFLYKFARVSSTKYKFVWIIFVIISMGCIHTVIIIEIIKIIHNNSDSLEDSFVQKKIEF